MARGKRTPKETKIQVAKRVRRGEEPEELATEFGVASSTIIDWAKEFGNNSSPKKKLTTHRPRPNALKAENENLKREVAFWRDAYLAEYRKNALPK